MSVSHLLQPRFLVTALFPGSKRKVGDIIFFQDLPGWPILEYYTEFPHLFRPLYWYEKRSPEALPGYVRIKGVVYKVNRWHNNFGAIPFADSDSLLGQNKTFLSVEWHFYAKQSEPATEQDYLTYIQPL